MFNKIDKTIMAIISYSRLCYLPQLQYTIRMHQTSNIIKFHRASIFNIALWNIVGGGCKEGKEGNALFKPLSMVVQSAW